MEKKEIAISLKLPPEVHKSLRLLAAMEGKTAKDCILLSLDKTYPGWRERGKENK